MRVRAGEGWREVREGLVRGPESSRVDAWARVRPRERDGDRGHAEEQAVAGEGTGGREGAREERRGERREGWTGWIRRLAAIDFSRQTHGLFVPLLVLVLLPSFPPLAFSLPPTSPSSRASGSPAFSVLSVLSLARALSLPSCSLMPCRPSILDLCLSLFLLSLFLSFLRAFASGGLPSSFFLSSSSCPAPFLLYSSSRFVYVS